MDAYQQHHHRFMRPPQPPQPAVPPSSADPHHYLHHQPRPPVPPQATWYSNQFQYNPPPPPSSHSPSPPPPHQWAAAPLSDHVAPPLPSSAYPPPPPPPLPYSSHQFPPPPPRPHLSAPPPHSQFPQSYPQEWKNPNWSQHQGWDYQAHNNVEDWAARARAWAAQKAAMEDQHPQSQFTQVSRMEEQNRYHDQYQQTADSHYQEIQQQSFPASGYQQFPVSAAPSYQQPIVYSQVNASFSSGQSSNDGRVPYIVGGGTSVGAPTTSPSVLQQEVPSSYSSVAGKEEATDQKDQHYKSLPLPVSSTQEGQHHVQPPSAFSGSVLTEQPFAYGNQGVDLSNQPLDFASTFGSDHDPHMQSSYGTPHDSAGSVRGHGPVPPLPTINSWTPAVATGAVYPPISSGLSSGREHDPSVAIPSPVSGHTAPSFGSFPGPGFQPAISSAGVPYGLGSGTVLLPSTGFPGDAYGVSNVSERPKKASVPNWLKEEIIKNASVITRSSLEHPKEETQSIEGEGEGVEKSFGKGDQADSKSVDSSRSTEEEDEDEDDIDAAQTAAINQEIKRVLTEVLLKVTDELFDEIATKVLHEDDLTDEVDHITVTSNNKVSPSPPEIPTPKASAKVLVPVKDKESETEDISEKSSSSAPGNVLGLANYASDEDDDEEEEIKSSTMSNFRKNNVLQQSSIPNISEDLHDATENGNSLVDIGKNSEGRKDLETDIVKSSNIESRRQINAVTSELSEHKYSSKGVSGTRVVELAVDGGKISDTSNGSGSKATFGKNVVDNSQVRETMMKPDEDHLHERRRNYSGKEKAERGSWADEKGDGNHRKQNEKHLRKQKTDDQSASKERMKERGDRTDEKAKESDSRKRSSHLDVKEDRKELEKLHRSSAKEDDNRKRGPGKDKEEDRARHKPTSDSSRHKRRRSSSSSSRGRNSKDNNTSDEASDDSKRRLHSRKRNLSPSPGRSRRRQVSRSPHSKHSQRRHSPYSSLEMTRGRRSRSKSPVRRHR